MQVGESDLSPDAVVREGDTVKVLAPHRAGAEAALDRVRHRAAGRAASRSRSERPRAPINILVEERNVRVSGGTLALADSQVIEGRSFRRYTGRVPAGGTVAHAVSAAGAAASSRVLAALVGAVALVLAVAAVRVVRRPRRRRRRRAPAAMPMPGRLLDAIAALDARYAGREAETAAGGVGALPRGAGGAQGAARARSCGSWARPLRLTPSNNRSTRMGTLGNRCNTGAAPPL